MKQPPLIIIMGPTASGKSALALTLAETLQAEIISADSRQLYRKMDIGTAKPNREELARVPHHVIDIRDPDENFSAGEFGNLARGIIAEKMAAGIPLVVCGGSGLYIQALLGMIFEKSATDPDIRQNIQRLGNDQGWDKLWLEWRKHDESAAKVNPNDIKRISRAWEIYKMTGAFPGAHYEKQELSFPWEYHSFAINPDRETLWKRIAHRTEKMLQKGLIEELEKLLQEGYSPELNSLKSVGYSETIAFLNGEISRTELTEQIIIHTRQFSKRQKTWFRKYAPQHWLEYEGKLPMEKFLQKILQETDNASFQ
jgi:tRNA dimethylallyltransferase